MEKTRQYSAVRELRRLGFAVVAVGLLMQVAMPTHAQPGASSAFCSGFGTPIPNISGWGYDERFGDLWFFFQTERPATLNEIKTECLDLLFYAGAVSFIWQVQAYCAKQPDAVSIVVYPFADMVGVAADDVVNKYARKDRVVRASYKRTGEFEWTPDEPRPGAQWRSFFIKPQARASDWRSTRGMDEPAPRCPIDTLR